jgi:hypothetical protein
MEDESRLCKKQKVLVETEMLSVLKLNHFSDYPGKSGKTQARRGLVSASGHWISLISAILIGDAI